MEWAELAKGLCARGFDRVLLGGGDDTEDEFEEWHHPDGSRATLTKTADGWQCVTIPGDVVYAGPAKGPDQR